MVIIPIKNIVTPPATKKKKIEFKVELIIIGIYE